MKKTKIQDFLDEINCGCKADEFIKNMKSRIENIKTSKEFTESLAFHEALGNIYRLLIYSILKDEPLCTCSLAEILALSEGSISHHIKKLEKAGLVFGKRQGRFTIYYTKSKFLELFT